MNDDIKKHLDTHPAPLTVPAIDSERPGWTFPVCSEYAGSLTPDQRRQLEVLAVKLGTANQQERYAAGLLPEDELLAIARTELFKPFELLAQQGVKRWNKDTRVRLNEIRHERSCEERNDTSPEAILFESCQAGELTHGEWETYRIFQKHRDIAAAHPWLATVNGVVLEPIAHFATCSVCQAEASRMSVKVTVHWAGRALVREYVLR